MTKQSMTIMFNELATSFYTKREFRKKNLKKQQ